MIKDSLSVLPMRRDIYQLRLGFFLFIATLTVFFAASLIGYLLIRFSDSADRAVSLNGVPVSLWVSTVFMFGVGYSLHRAVGAVRFEKQTWFRRWLFIAGGMALVFLVFQSLGLRRLLAEHDASGGDIKMYGLMFFLVLVHALHVIGGLTTLAVVTNRANRDGYDHENYVGVSICADYWHFLDAVWVVMLIVFAVTG
ncbi:cytochrome c oxidase subunit 3 [Blastopirellula sp. JC732]|uniref:Cytochrome c oxidase subunit 3 n=1 Tax=Blastopirellula sediminis TaxID=2894196 RepID=A0A9X1MLZ5_9BACT|nr:cytochrome c oxidase subunit 3 [Blastopirellula sediminis]MCC9608881.1 cytochrome c oxidase subunit 3 [Blastopirellula sediminis]MCC9628342.1 cytochrome c oxidase subunit 3 [Blastopirellula sediminis]